jgi:Xaa-Pro dipeptidase
MRRRGATSTWFTTIVGFGPNSADPHYSTGDRQAKSGEFLLSDFGPVYNHYGADITRTFIFESPDSKSQKIYETVLQAQLDSLDAIHAGVIAHDIDAIARNIIEKNYPDRFIHSLGHGLGIGGGRIGPGSDLILEPGMVFTVEPGIYLRDYGGVRIEDDIVVTKEGYELLTTAKKEEMIEIPL